MAFNALKIEGSVSSIYQYLNAYDSLVKVSYFIQLNV